MKIPMKHTFYFWHEYYPDYDARMAAMAEYVRESVMHSYIVANLKLVPKGW